MEVDMQSTKLERGAAFATVFCCILTVSSLVLAENINAPVVFDVGITKYRDNGVFYQGEPICVRVGMRGRKAEGGATNNPIAIGTTILPWHNNVTLGLYRPKESTVIPSNEGRVGTGETSVSLFEKELLSDVKFELCGPQQNIFELRPNNYAMSFWALSPNTTSNLPAGEYVIQAKYEMDGKSLMSDGPEDFDLASSEVLIVLSTPPKESAIDVEILEAQARYNELQQKYDESIVLLKKILSIDANKQEIHCQLGRAYELKGDLNTAIGEYQSYVKWARGQISTGKDGLHNHANVIESTIRALEKKISDAGFKDDMDK